MIGTRHGQHGFAHARQVLDEQVPAGQQTGHGLTNLQLLAKQHAANLITNLDHGLAHCRQASGFCQRLCHRFTGHAHLPWKDPEYLRIHPAASAVWHRSGHLQSDSNRIAGAPHGRH